MTTAHTQKNRAFSLRTNLYFLLLTSLLPAFAFALSSTSQERDYRIARIENDAIQLNELALISQQEFVERVRHFLIALASLPAAQYEDEARCNRTMQTILQQVHTYINVGIANTDGSIRCSAIEVPQDTTLADRWYFRRAVQTGDFAIGEFQIGRITGRASLNFGYPMTDTSGTMTGIVFAAVDLATISNLLYVVDLPQGSTLTLFDHKGTVLARYPDHETWVGRSAADMPLTSAMLDSKLEGTYSGVGLDQVERIYSYSPVDGGEAGSLFLALGIPSEVAYAEMYRILSNHFLSLSIAALVAAAMLTFGISRHILRPLNEIVSASQQLIAGNMASRVRLQRGPKEIQLLGEAFDHTVDSLVKREAERAQTAEELRLVRDELEQRVVERTAELERANQELESFSYSISHDLRAPLRSMNGFSRILEEEYSNGLAPEALRYLRLVRDSADNMGLLIDDLLNFSRLSRQPISKQSLDLVGLVQQVWEGLKDERAERTIIFEIEPLPTCEADPALIKQVFINLLGNAVKFTGQRQQALIQVGSYVQNGEAVYFVRDNGAGFDMRYGDKLFGVFQRLHRADEFEGTGVGLAIVQRIIVRHGGRIWPDSRVNEGATFYFTLKGALHDGV